MSTVDVKGTILGRIVEDTEALTRQRKRERSLSSLLSEPGFGRTPASLASALSGDGLSVIAEVKKASPSKGVIREDFHPVRIADSYRSGGAAALSVLTEPLHFQGSPDFLRAIRAEVDLPLLRKDFILDPYQVAEARAWGADAILLIAACLDRAHLAELQAAADEWGLETLVEVYDPRELDRVDLDTSRIIGANSRDLRTFEVDLDRAIGTLGALPAGILRVAESGLSSQADFARVRDAGIEAVLVGESFMRAPDPGAALHAILEYLS
ncbi:MAG: indole-3-glycerol phosphate synthase TrpC [Bacteroidetes bacterium]|nr:indole-3-glycerol phosphate synthase TrpC [Bacteroidota bacterium]MDA0874148.1 indole-3-glycerol phosphate synthase TrpC [Bacteroidota bacterium]